MPQRNRLDQQQIKRLKARLETLTEERGIQADESLDTEVREIDKEQSPSSTFIALCHPYLLFIFAENFVLLVTIEEISILGQQLTRTTIQL